VIEMMFGVLKAKKIYRIIKEVSLHSLSFLSVHEENSLYYLAKGNIESLLMLIADEKQSLETNQTARKIITTL